MTTEPSYASRVDGHYSVGGVLYPAVSTILAPIKGEYPADPKWANRGTLMHSAFEAQLKGTVDGVINDWLKDEIDRQRFIIDRRWVYPFVAGIVDWAADNVESVEYVEVQGVSALLGLAGTADGRRMRLIKSEAWWILDAKSQADFTPEKWHRAQLAALNSLSHIAYVDGPGPAFDRCDAWGNLYVNEKGEAQLRSWTREQIWDAYNRCVWPLLCQYHARKVVTSTQATVDEWRSQRTVAGYWPPRPAPPPRPSRADRRARASAEQWGHMPQEVG